MRKRPVLVLVPLALLFVVSGLVQAARDSATVDEAIDVAAGVTSLVRHDLRLTPEHDLLMRLATLPALAAHPIVPEADAYRDGAWFDHTDDFIRANRDAGRLQRILFLARLVPLGEGLAVGLVLYALGARLFGSWSGVLAAGLWFTTPVCVGFSHVVSIDVTFTLAALLVALALVWFLEAPSDRRAAVVGLAVGGALLARQNGLVLAAAMVIVLLVGAGAAWRRDGLRWTVIGLVVSWLTVWVAFRGFALHSVGGVPGQRFDGIIASARHQSLLARIVLAVPWPKEWAAGFGYLVLTSTARPAYLLGHAWDGSRWWFFPGSLLVKAPLGVLAVLVLGPIGWRRHSAEVRRRAALAVVVPAVVLFAALVLQPLNLGLRYAFPSVALWLVAAGPAVHAGRSVLGRGALGLLLATQLISSAVAFPHAMAWTPPPFQDGYRWATDSNIDYGQDERAVERWAEGKSPWVALLEPRGIDPPPGSRPLVGADPRTVMGWAAVSATRLMALDRDALAWLRAYCPVGTIGGSVLLYRFDAPPDAAAGPTMPPAPCGGEVSVRTP